MSTEQTSVEHSLQADQKSVATVKDRRAPLPVMFWGYLVGGTVFWAIIYVVAGLTFMLLIDKPDETVAGTVLLIISALFYLWGFVFSGLSIGAAFRYKGSAVWKWLTYVFCTCYIIALMVMLVVLIHVMTVI